MSSSTESSALDRALSPAEAAAYLGVSAKTLRNWRSSGRGPRFLKYGHGVDSLGRISGAVAYRLSDLEAFRSAAVVTPSGGDL